MPRRLVVGQRTLDPFTEVRILAGQPTFVLNSGCVASHSSPDAAKTRQLAVSLAVSNTARVGRHLVEGPVKSVGNSHAHPLDRGRPSELAGSQ